MKDFRSDRAALAGFVLAAVGALLLGLQAWPARRAVLRSDLAPIPTAAVVDPGRSLLAQLAEKDGALHAASLSGRDPFRQPPLPREPVRAQVARRDSTEGPQPSVCGLVFDEQDPRVMLSTGVETSGWLRRGELFQGWMVVGIDRRTVTIQRKGETVVLPSS